MAKVEKITIKHRVKVLGEDGKPLTNDKGNFVWEEVEQEYRVDTAFVPSNVSEICEQFIENFCAESQDRIDWLLEEIDKKELHKNRKTAEKEEKNISFVSLRSAFAHKYFPACIKEKKKKEDFRTKIRERFNKK